MKNDEEEYVSPCTAVFKYLRFEGWFLAFQRFSSSELVLKAVGRRVPALSCSASSENTTGLLLQNR